MKIQSREKKNPLMSLVKQIPVKRRNLTRMKPRIDESLVRKARRWCRKGVKRKRWVWVSRTIVTQIGF